MLSVILSLCGGCFAFRHLKRLVVAHGFGVWFTFDGSDKRYEQIVFCSFVRGFFICFERAIFGRRANGHRSSL